ncbi:MAG: hypothetical protein A3G34_01990 [Candidatus Lindowbacteria bacterium RIFCSPLOWO2_12_FULL_62_27]|nr:MAG: hypothetical protein A3I06_11510 [Candidatus Lindowbacteria bacterium RIFCSPLOWO2_02_FULL_62_12]OGH59078.1 MAG: hypothetical protein A3G34_01990 [Candidatus Lindowbacteria bacterium RIFCSPLOWO2_12_FULL_62_27]
MKSSIADFAVISPRTLAEALASLRQTPPPVPLAGGTDIMVLLNAGQLEPGVYLNLYSVPELRRPIEVSAGVRDAGTWGAGGADPPGEVRLSALTTYADVRRHAEVRRLLPMLPLAAREIGAVQIQSRATWAGNIANASPAADGVPPLMAYDATVELSSAAGVRQVALSEFYSGYKQTARRPDELITGIRIPVPAPGSIDYFRKVGTRKFQAISKVLLAGLVELGGSREIRKIRLVFASVMPFTYRARKTESVLEGRRLEPGAVSLAVETLRTELKPIDDIRSTARYRLKVACNLLEEFLGTTMGC